MRPAGFRSLKTMLPDIAVHRCCCPRHISRRHMLPNPWPQPHPFLAPTGPRRGLGGPTRAAGFGSLMTLPPGAGAIARAAAADAAASGSMSGVIEEEEEGEGQEDDEVDGLVETQEEDDRRSRRSGHGGSGMAPWLQDD